MYTNLPATSNSGLSSTSPIENNQTSETEHLFPPILDIDNLLPSNENISSFTPANILSQGSSESIQESSSGHVLLPPIFLGHNINGIAL